jgi:hypothetical protein
MERLLEIIVKPSSPNVDNLPLEKCMQNFPRSRGDDCRKFFKVWEITDYNSLHLVPLWDLVVDHLHNGHLRNQTIYD